MPSVCTAKQQGFSLIEIIVTMFLVLVIFTLTLIEMNALTIVGKQRNESIAYYVAIKQMEQLRATEFDDLPDSGTISNPLLGEIPSGSGSFSVSDYSGYTDLKEIIVTVNWNDGTGKSAVVRTLAGNGGINPSL